jgi:hypothetical protein
MCSADCCGSTRWSRYRRPSDRRVRAAYHVRRGSTMHGQGPEPSQCLPQRPSYRGAQRRGQVRQPALARAIEVHASRPRSNPIFGLRSRCAQGRSGAHRGLGRGPHSQRASCGELPPGPIRALDSGSVELAKTASRTVLGYMNDRARFCEYAVAESGALARSDVQEVNRELRRQLQLSRQPPGYFVPIDLAQ